MTRSKLFAAVAISLSMLALPAVARVDKDVEAASHFLISPALIQKLKNAEKDMKSIDKEEDNDNDDDGDRDQSIDGIVKKIERNPKARAMLAKHNIAPREMALATFAMLHAGMWVATESAMDKKKAAASYAALTREQKANIELMRTYSKAAKK